MALSVKQLYEVMAQLPDPVFILSEDGYYIEYIGGWSSNPTRMATR